jgi:hypothetical protein
MRKSQLPKSHMMSKHGGLYGYWIMTKELRNRRWYAPPLIENIQYSYFSNICKREFTIYAHYCVYQSQIIKCALTLTSHLDTRQIKVQPLSDINWLSSVEFWQYQFKFKLICAVTCKIKFHTESTQHVPLYNARNYVSRKPRPQLTKTAVYGKVHSNLSL